MDIWEASEKTQGGRKNPEYIKAFDEARRLAMKDGIDRLLKEHKLDALVSVTASPGELMVRDGTTSPYASMLSEHKAGEFPPSAVNSAATAGYPVMSVPMGLVDGLPVGILFVGPAWSEALLISLAYDYEQASHARVAPPRALSALAR